VGAAHVGVEAGAEGPQREKAGDRVVDPLLVELALEVGHTVLRLRKLRGEAFEVVATSLIPHVALIGRSEA
jgi:hypothetical protein